MKLTSHRRHLLIITISALLVTACGGGGGPQGDPILGKQVYAQCAGCHQLQQNAGGPMHCGVVGRAAGSVANYQYSEAMKDSGLVWDEKTLDEFLVAPIAFVHGTKMGFAGLGDATDRANVIAYLRDVGRDPAVCPPT
jgi:cytochrome c